MATRTRRTSSTRLRASAGRIVSPRKRRSTRHTTRTTTRATRTTRQVRPHPMTLAEKEALINSVTASNLTDRQKMARFRKALAKSKRRRTKKRPNKGRIISAKAKIKRSNRR